MPFSEMERAWAKINLTLDVKGRRPDGYHDVCMVMQTVSLFDTLEIREIRDPPGGIRVHTNLSYLPMDETNLAARAAMGYFDAAKLPMPGLEIRIQKQIPVCAGMAGGSSNAAAVLRALNRVYQALDEKTLLRVGMEIGSDVPYCILGGTMLAQGRGERLTPLKPLPPCHFVLCKPQFSVSTPTLFSKIKCDKIRCRPDTQGILLALEAEDLDGVARRAFNVFDALLEPKRQEELKQIRAVLVDCGAIGASMSGTGPTMFGMFDYFLNAKKAFDNLSKQYQDCFLVQNV